MTNPEWPTGAADDFYRQWAEQPGWVDILASGDPPSIRRFAALLKSRGDAYAVGLFNEHLARHVAASLSERRKFLQRALRAYEQLPEMVLDRERAQSALDAVNWVSNGFAGGILPRLHNRWRLIESLGGNFEEFIDQLEPMEDLESYAEAVAWCAAALRSPLFLLEDRATMLERLLDNSQRLARPEMIEALESVAPLARRLLDLDAPNLTSGHDRLLDLLASAYQEAGMHQLALDLLRQATDSQPHRVAELAMVYSACLHEMGESEEFTSDGALELFESALAVAEEMSQAGASIPPSLIHIGLHAADEALRQADNYRAYSFIQRQRRIGWDEADSKVVDYERQMPSLRASAIEGLVAFMDDPEMPADGIKDRLQDALARARSLELTPSESSALVDSVRQLRQRHYPFPIGDYMQYVAPDGAVSMHFDIQGAHYPQLSAIGVFLSTVETRLLYQQLKPGPERDFRLLRLTLEDGATSASELAAKVDWLVRGPLMSTLDDSQRLELSNVLIDRGKSTLARRIVPDVPTGPDATLQQIRELLGSGRRVEALEVAESAFSKNPMDWSLAVASTFAWASVGDSPRMRARMLHLRELRPLRKALDASEAVEMQELEALEAVLAKHHEETTLASIAQIPGQPHRSVLDVTEHSLDPGTLEVMAERWSSVASPVHVLALFDKIAAGGNRLLAIDCRSAYSNQQRNLARELHAQTESHSRRSEAHVLPALVRAYMDAGDWRAVAQYLPRVSEPRARFDLARTGAIRLMSVGRYCEAGLLAERGLDVSGGDITIVDRAQMFDLAITSFMNIPSHGVRRGATHVGDPWVTKELLRRAESLDIHLLLSPARFSAFDLTGDFSGAVEVVRRDCALGHKRSVFVAMSEYARVRNPEMAIGFVEYLGHCGLWDDESLAVLYEACKGLAGLSPWSYRIFRAALDVAVDNGLDDTQWDRRLFDLAVSNEDGPAIEDCYQRALRSASLAVVDERDLADLKSMLWQVIEFYGWQGPLHSQLIGLTASQLRDPTVFADAARKAFADGHSQIAQSLAAAGVSLAEVLTSLPSAPVRRQPIHSSDEVQVSERSADGLPDDAAGSMEPAMLVCAEGLEVALRVICSAVGADSPTFGESDDETALSRLAHAVETCDHLALGLDARQRFVLRQLVQEDAFLGAAVASVDPIARLLPRPIRPCPPESLEVFGLGLAIDRAVSESGTRAAGGALAHLESKVQVLKDEQAAVNATRNLARAASIGDERAAAAHERVVISVSTRCVQEDPDNNANPCAEDLEIASATTSLYSVAAASMSSDSTNSIGASVPTLIRARAATLLAQAASALCRPRAAVAAAKCAHRDIRSGFAARKGTPITAWAAALDEVSSSADGAVLIGRMAALAREQVSVPLQAASLAASEALRAALGNAGSSGSEPTGRTNDVGDRRAGPGPGLEGPTLT